MQRGIRYRLYPTKEQALFLTRNAGCCRKAYNECLSFRKLAYDADGTSLSDTELVNTLPSLRKFYPYMKEADSASLQQAVRHLNTAYRNFFSGTSGYPVFRKRKSSLSYTTPMNGNSIKVGSKSITLPKAGTIKAVIHRSITGRILSATVRRNACGQWFCSVLYDIPDKPVSCTINTGNTVGLDYKSDGLYVSSGNEICGSPKFYRVMERKLARAERRLSRKKGFRRGEKKSHNFWKQRLRIARIHQKISNQRFDFLHKESLKLADHYDLIAVEDLDMKAMSNHDFRNGKATLDNGYGMFLNMLEYKLRDRGKQLIRIDRWYPSSQVCHTCGTRNPITKDLKIRRVTCPVCHTTYDRDENASLNIRDEGVRMYLKSINKDLSA